MKKRDRIYTALLITVLVVGLFLLLYPSFSDWWNSRVQTKLISNYNEIVAKLDTEDYTALWDSARAYNGDLWGRNNPYLLEESQRERYNGLLNPAGDGIMGYVQIPDIDVALPIYHGTDELVLQTAIGHLDWTSLPVGGAGTHCVISGHRGLPSARLFTDLDKVMVGDVFMLHVLDETLTYEVDQIRIVEPDETDELLLQEGKDLCTLVTCTPYGVNSHRLLVRGHRVENLAETVTVRVTADAVVVEKLVVAPFVLLPILLVMLVWLFASGRKRKK
jgi:sortase A